MDPHIRAYRDYDQNADQSYRDFPDGRPNDFMWSGMESGFGEDIGMSMRISRLYQSLEEKGDYATLDKAKRNEHFREYLLTNFDEQEYGHDYY